MNFLAKLNYNELMHLIQQSIKRKRPFSLFLQELDRDYNIKMISPQITSLLRKEYEMQEDMYAERTVKYNRV